MNDTGNNSKAQYLDILGNLQSLHPDGQEITLKFSDHTAMEIFKLAAMNALFADKHGTLPDAANDHLEDHIKDQHEQQGKQLYPERHESIKEELFGHKPSKRAAILCRNPLFWSHLESTQSLIFEQIDSLKAKYYVRQACGIESRRELDYNLDAEDRYHKLIENPFLAWLAQ